MDREGEISLESVSGGGGRVAGAVRCADRARSEQIARQLGCLSFAAERIGCTDGAVERVAMEREGSNAIDAQTEPGRSSY